MKRVTFVAAASLLALAGNAGAASQLKLNEQGYFEAPGLNVTVFADIYPDGHQTGVTVIQHGERVAANGDLRLEPSPGQWKGMKTVSGRIDVEMRAAATAVPRVRVTATWSPALMPCSEASSGWTSTNGSGSVASSSSTRRVCAPD